MQQSLEIVTTNAQKLTVQDTASLSEATALLSTLNVYLDELTAHKEEKTKPLNQALKKIREDYRPRETILTQAIDHIRLTMTTYATNEANRLQQEEKRILEDKRTSDITKINRLATITPTTEKVTTEQGSITFTTVTKYRIKDPSKIPLELLELNVTLLKSKLKEPGYITPEGIETYEEKSLRNFR